ncbi:hypothetical protein OG535_09900 [Kitasatospora sp. NBC_00085]|uniref:hypothetical protein n=1 Tax=unclassified Kitasatospora TaxID=2633591 RepID=UPI0032522C39
MPVLTAHVVTQDAPADLLARLRRCTADHFGIAHTALQVEPAGLRSCERPVHS